MNNYLLPLLNATSTTLSIAITSLIIGLIFAFVFTLLESVKFKPISGFISIFLIIVRSLPELLIVIAIYNGIPLLLIFINDVIFDGGMDVSIPLGFTDLNFSLEISNYDISPILCGIVALSLLYAAYASQILRGAFKAIPIGQKQAAQILGLSKSRTLWKIIIPQLWRHALPGLGNQWLILLKDTALVSLIAVEDVMKQTKNIIATTKEPFTWYLVAGLIYLLISIISQKIIHKIELKTRYYDNSPMIGSK